MITELELPSLTLYRKLRLLALAVCCAIAAPCVAQGTGPGFSLPLECEIGKNCMVQNYFDHDPRTGIVDYSCGSRTYDGHDGTDIRLPNLQAMKKGIRVIAAADGQVRAIRDGMEDISFRDIDKAAIKDKEAGNSVAIDHGNGWETQYSHLRKGSVLVKPGEEIKRGQPLGLVGLSGQTEFPHLHFTVRYNGVKIDPFAGPGDHIQCGLALKPVWDSKTYAALRYTPSGALDGGFAGDIVTFEQVRAGRVPVPGTTAPALVFWMDIYGAVAGDEEHIQIYGPDGQLFSERRSKIAANKAEWFSYAGKKRSANPWPAGTYRGEYTLTRRAVNGSQKVVSFMREVRLER